MRGAPSPRSAAIALLVGVAVGACARNSPVQTLPSPEPSASPTPKQISPGHDSPRAAVVGLISGLAGSNEQIACGYVVPVQQQLCRTALPFIGVEGFRLGHTVVNGDRALVTLIVDSFCIGDACFSNQDPDAGLPMGTTGFGAAFRRTLDTGSDPATACRKVDGNWFVQIQPG